MSEAEAAALNHIELAEKTGCKIDGVSVAPVPIHKVGIVGAGLMGGGIGMSCAEAGIKVKLVDVSEKALKRGMNQIEANYKRSRRLSDAQKKEYLENISGSLEMADLADCDLVVEAVFEEMGMKKDIFRKFDEICKPGAFLCSNTSFLSIDEMASVTSRPEFVMGTHFFSPANIMKLLENVRGAKTSDLTIASVMSWGERIGKNCILVGNCHGFVGNRLSVGFYGMQAQRMLYRGVLPEQIDGAAERFGMKMGPIAMADMAGLDLGIQAVKKKGQFNPKKVFVHGLIDAGRVGQKAKMGYYDYDADRKRSPSPQVAEMLKIFVAAQGKTPLELTEEQIVQRLFFPMINEGFQILDEGFAQRPSDIDVCFVNGYSFPRNRGGPMYYADQVGLPKVKEFLESMQIKPARLLNACVAEGKTLAEFWPSKPKDPNSRL